MKIYYYILVSFYCGAGITLLLEHLVDRQITYLIIHVCLLIIFMVGLIKSDKSW